MLFHSIDFIFGFLPICFVGFVVIQKYWGTRASLFWLAIASIFFYGQWSAAHAVLLIGSVTVNFFLCRLMLATDSRDRLRRQIFFGSIAANLGLLGYLKYMNFFIDNVNAVSGADYTHINVLIPVGVSFFTFIQIGFLVEVYNRQVKQVRFIDYFVFGSFFSYITAGPLVLQRDMIPQFDAKNENPLNATRIAVAVTVFSIGLFKKLALADSIAPYADTVFDGVAGGALPSSSLAWIGALAYTAQLYFDFSGYSDMALGIGLLFNLKLPLNFNSPLKATSITDFWRRWHMTMTRFFTNYLFSPLAVTNTRRALIYKYGPVRRFLATVAVPVIFTFLLAGIWHGAGWTFVVFGLIHGVALAINHAWVRSNAPKLPAGFCWILTMFVVIAGLVVFRAPDLTVATTILQAMALPDLSVLGWLEPAAAGEINYADAIALITLLFAIILTMPNTQQLMHGYEISSDERDEEEAQTGRWVRWKPSPKWALASACILTVGLSLATGDTQFIYYQF